jgi:hypothetical protein
MAKHQGCRRSGSYCKPLTSRPTDTSRSALGVKSLEVDSGKDRTVRRRPDRLTKMSCIARNRSYDNR